MRSLLALVLLFLISEPVLGSAPSSFGEAKIAMREKIYHDRNESDKGSFYCGCHWRWTGRSGGRFDLAGCGYKIRAQEHRAIRLEWEHVFPASSFGQQRQCWQKGGRQNCNAVDQNFRAIEADMHNLTPSIGEVNADRSNFRFGVLPSTAKQHGSCDFKVDFKQRVAEPRDQVKGQIARIYFYMHDRYSLQMSRQQQELFMAWHKKFPVSEWERERDRRIAAVMGHGNPFVSGEREWTLDHKNKGEGLVHLAHTPAKEVQAPVKEMVQSSYQGPVRGNKRSKVYHLPNCPAYDLVSESNRHEFESEAKAQEAGFRRAGNCN